MRRAAASLSLAVLVAPLPLQAQRPPLYWHCSSLMEALDLDGRPSGDGGPRDVGPTLDPDGRPTSDVGPTWDPDGSPISTANSDARQSLDPNG